MLVAERVNTARSAGSRVSTPSNRSTSTSTSTSSTTTTTAEVVDEVAQVRALEVSLDTAIVLGDRLVGVSDGELLQSSSGDAPTKSKVWNA